MKSRRDEDSDEDTEKTSSTSSEESPEKPRGGKSKALSEEESSSDTSSSSLSDESGSETEPEVDLRRGKIAKLAKEARQQLAAPSVAVNKKLTTLPTQQPVTNTLKKDLMRTRVVRKSLEAVSPPKPKIEKEKLKGIPEKAVEKKNIKKPLPKKPTDDVPKKKNVIEIRQDELLDPGKMKLGGTLKKKTGITQKKKVSESAPLLKSSTKVTKTEEEARPKDLTEVVSPKAEKRQTIGTTQKKKVTEQVPARRLAVKKTDETPVRTQRALATVRNDGRSVVVGRPQQRKAEAPVRAPARKSELQPRNPQSRTAFTMSGLKQVPQVKNLAKERLIGQSDQA